MTGVILVVDDVPANVKLLEAKLTNEYYDVITAKDGFEAIEQTKNQKPDLILLDVMMPGMDGFETCRKIKEDPEVSHIPIVMVTALSEMSDRLQGLEAGADDFITKPINDTALFARVKSLVRIKVLIDELRLRDQSGAQMGLINEIVQGGLDVSGASIVVVDDDAVQCKHVREALGEDHPVSIFTDHNEALDHVKQEAPDLIMISTMLMDIDGLRLATQFKAIDSLRNVPIITLVDEDDTTLMLKALELGVNDYLVVPIEASEMVARVRTQLRRKRYQDALKSNYKESVSMAITDALTGLYNRHYLDTHLKNLAEASLENGKNMSLVIMDMDHFKHVNDTYGHDVGDEVLKQLAKLIVDATRSSDLVSRFGGEEFVVLMPETDFQNAYDVAERIRASIENTPFQVSHEIGTLSKTMSIGVASLNHSGDSGEAMLKRADTALYAAKNGGRNQVQPKKVDDVLATATDSADAPPAAPPADAPPTDSAPPAGAPQAPPAQPPQAATTPPPVAPPADAMPSVAPPVAPAPVVPTAPAAVPEVSAAPAVVAPPPMPAPPAPPVEAAPVAPPPAAPIVQPAAAPPAPIAPAPQPHTPPPAALPVPPAPAEQALPADAAAPAPHPFLTPNATGGATPPPPAPAQPAPALQPAQPATPNAAPSLQPRPLTPDTPPPPIGGGRVPPAPGYNPNLTTQPAAPAQSGVGPNALSPKPDQMQQMRGIRPAQPANRAGAKGDKRYRSPIDDEPEGTF